MRFASDRTGYRLLNPGLMLPVSLRIPEILALLSPGRSSADYGQSARLKLASALPPPLNGLFRDPRRVATSIPVTPVAPTIWSVIDDALAKGHRIKFRYKGNNDEGPKDRRADPYAIFLKGTGWYLAAWAPERSDYRSFRVDRLENVASTYQRFEPRDDFRIADFISNPLGVGAGQALNGKVQVFPSHLTSVQSEARAVGLLLQPSGKGAILEIPIGVVDQVAWWLAPFGEGIKVLGPPALRVRLLQIAQRIIALHRG